MFLYFQKSEGKKMVFLRAGIDDHTQTGVSFFLSFLCEDAERIKLAS